MRIAKEYQWVLIRFRQSSYKLLISSNYTLWHVGIVLTESKLVAVNSLETKLTEQKWKYLVKKGQWTIIWHQEILDPKKSREGLDKYLRGSEKYLITNQSSTFEKAACCKWWQSPTVLCKSKFQNRQRLTSCSTRDWFLVFKTSYFYIQKHFLGE